MNRIPLAQRLGQDSGAVAPVHLGFLPLWAFFESLDWVNGGGRYSDIYYGIIREALENLSSISDDDTMFDDPFDSPANAKFKDETLFAEAVTMVMNLPRKERANLLYHIMIEPFT